MKAEERLEIIKRNTAEIVQEDELLDILKSKVQPSAYIGTAPTGRIHIGYFFWVSKAADFIRAGFKFKILLADIHAHLDDQKAPWELLDYRVDYYKEVLLGMLEAIGIDTKNVEFVRGSDFQLDRKYTMDMYRLAALNTFSQCKHAASEVVRFGDTPKLSGFIYPILQALDEQYLDVDVQFGGIDQRKIMMFARENLPRIGYRRRVEVMNPMLPGLTGGKMSSSDPKSKIDCLDAPESVAEKVKSAYCVAGEAEDNGLFALLKHVIMPLRREFVIERPEKFGGNAAYNDYDSLEKDFKEKKIHPLDLKNALAKEVNLLLEPVRKRFDKKPELLAKAYP
ncbi:MAG: tyrosine--tRNA ligase [Nanoarchaeota archaeon]